MPSDKLRAEWFWVDRWQTSSAMELPLIARGLYRELLSLAWMRGGQLPSDPERLRRLCRVSPEEWSTAWPLVARYWQTSEDGQTISNATQLEVLAETHEQIEAKSAAGKKAAETRWAKQREPKADAKRSATAHATAYATALRSQCPQDQDQDRDLEPVSSPSAQASQKHSSPTSQPRREAPSPAISRTPEVPAVAEVAPAALGSGEVTAELFAEAPSAASESREEPSPYRGSAPLALPASEVKPGQVTKAPSRSAIERARKAPATPEEHAAVLEVFGRWVDRHGFSRARLDPTSKRYAAVLHRLRDGYTVADLVEAIEGNAISPHHRGENAQGTTYHELQLICRDSEHVDRFRTIAERQEDGRRVTQYRPHVVQVTEGVAFEATGNARIDRTRLAAAKALASFQAQEGGAKGPFRGPLGDRLGQVKGDRHAV